MQELLEQYGLAPHPEGGWYRETYRVTRTLPGTPRSMCTAILYLLTAGQHSRLHRLDADELWHFHRGDPLHVIELAAGAPARVHVLSAEQPRSSSPPVPGSVPRPLPARAGRCAAARCRPASKSSAFELGDTARLLAEFPLAEREILALQGG